MHDRKYFFPPKQHHKGKLIGGKEALHNISYVMEWFLFANFSSGIDTAGQNASLCVNTHKIAFVPSVFVLENNFQ